MNDEKFARSIIAALDQGTLGLDSRTVARLSELRRQSITAGQDHTAIQHGVIAWTHGHPWRALIVVIGLAVAGWVGYQHQHTDVVDDDIRLLTDDLPPQVYAERDFARWLKSSAF